MIPQGAFVIDGLTPVKVTGVPVVYADRPGRNRNVYSRTTLTEAIDYYSRLCQLDGTYKYAFAKHPKDENEEWMGLIAGTVDKLYFEGNSDTVLGDFTLLPTIWGHFVNWLIKNDYPIGTSMRGSAQGKKGRITFGGKSMDVTNRSGLKLEGVDFVIYPSFITTHVNKGKVQEQYKEDGSSDDATYERVLESFCKETATETGLEVEDIKKLLKKQECTTDREGHDMDELELKRQKAQLDVERAELDIKRLGQEKAALDAEIARLGEEKEGLSSSVSDTHATLESHHRVNETLRADIVKTETELERIKGELAKTQQLLEASTAEYKELVDKTSEIIEKANNAKETNFKFAGMTFNDEAPPKMRVVPASEKVFEGDWNGSNNSIIQKLVALSGDHEIASSVFGLAEACGGKKKVQEGGGCGKGKKKGEAPVPEGITEQASEGAPVFTGEFNYPTYYPMKSEKEGYDIDLVLSTKGLASTASELSGKSGQTLGTEARNELLDFLRAKYQELQDAGYGEMPKSLQTASEKQEIAEKVTGSDEGLLADFIRHAIITGSLEIPTEKITEGTVYDEDRIKNAMIMALVVEPEVKPDEEVSEATTSGSIDRPLGQETAAIDTSTSTPVEGAGETSETDAAAAEDTTGEEDLSMNVNIIQKLREMLESRLEGVSIGDDEQVLDIIETLIEDYAKIYNDLEGLTLSNARSAKLNEMRASGIEESVIKEELDKAETIEDIEEAAERLSKLAKSIKESSTRETRRSVPIVPVAGGKDDKVEDAPAPTSDAMAGFEKIMRSV